MRVDEHLQIAGRVLGKAGVRDPSREAASLMCFVLDRDRTFLIAHPEYELTAVEAAKLDGVIERRAAREPFQYITGKQEFFGREFLVGPGILIPRPETELLVETAIHRCGGLPEPRFCEVGVGSGCISVTLLCELPGSSGVGLEISADAIKTAGENAGRLGVSERLEMRRSDIFSALEDEVFDFIASNPPYISAEQLTDLQPEVVNYEPRKALTDEEKGTSIIKRIIAGAPGYLKRGGWLFLEIGQGQDAEVRKMFDTEQWNSVDVLPDLQGIPRTIAAQLKA